MSTVALVAEDGTGLATANSFNALTDVEILILIKKLTQWNNYSETDRSHALIFATRMINNSELFIGRKKTDTQALAFPRVYGTEYGVGDGTLRTAAAEGSEYRQLSEIYSRFSDIEDTVPREIKYVTSLLALHHLMNPEDFGLSVGSIREVGIQSLRLTLDSPDSCKLILDRVRSILKPFAYGSKFVVELE